MITFWSILIFLCIMCCITHPTKGGFAVCSIFLLSILMPEAIQMIMHIEQGYQYLMHVMSALGAMILLTFLPYSKLEYAVKSLLLFEVVYNLFGLWSWYNWIHIHVSNFIFDLSGVSLAAMLGEMWIYNSIVILYYTVAVLTLYDRRSREKYVGNGILQFIGDTFLSPYIRFKGIHKWTS